MDIYSLLVLVITWIFKSLTDNLSKKRTIWLMKSLLLFIVVVYTLVALFKFEKLITFSYLKNQLDSAKSNYYNTPFSRQDSLRQLCGKEAWMYIDSITANYSPEKNIVKDATFYVTYIIIMTGIIILYVTFLIAYKPSGPHDKRNNKNSKRY